MSNLDELISLDMLHLLGGYQRIYVGFSGGLDSTVLLHYLQAQPLLHEKLIAVHVHHGLQSQADSWLTHCQKICQDWGVACQTFQLALSATANIESIARQARYQVFASLMQPQVCMVTAHHQDDQAETLLLHLMRGTGVKGLSGIAACSPFHQGFLLRPLLDCSRTQLQAYADRFSLSWIEDSSNDNQQFSRNFIRHTLIPQLQQRWPAVSKTLARTTDICRSTQANLDDLAKIDCPLLLAERAVPHILPLHDICALSADRVHNVVRFWLERHAIRPPSFMVMQQIRQALIEAKSDANPCIWVDAQHFIRRYQDKLYLERQLQPTYESKLIVWDNFPEPCNLLKLGVLHADLATQGLRVLADDRVCIRYRQGGERFVWHQQTKSLKKLFQEWQVPPWLRDSIPLLFINDQLAMVVGYAISDVFFTKSEPSYHIDYQPA